MVRGSWWSGGYLSSWLNKALNRFWGIPEETEELPRTEDQHKLLIYNDVWVNCAEKDEEYRGASTAYRRRDSGYLRKGEQPRLYERMSV